MLRPAPDFDTLRRQFAWRIPARFNIGADTVDRQAPSTLAMIVEHADGSVEQRDFRRFARDSNRLAQALRGLGIARLPDFTVRDELASGQLVSLFQSEVRSDQQILALFPKSQRMPAKLRLLLDFLVARLSSGGEAVAGVARIERPVALARHVRGA